MKLFRELSMISLVVFLVYIFSFTIYAVPFAAEVKTVKIGILVPLTGPIAGPGTNWTKGAELAAQWINDEGGIKIKGEKYYVELVTADMKMTADDFVAATRKLVEKEKVKFISGGIGSSGNLIPATITEPAGIIRTIFWIEGAPEELSPKLKYTFNGSVIGADTIPGLYQYLIEAYPKVQKIALLGIEGPTSETFFEIHSKRGAEPLGLKIVSREIFPLTTQDFYPVLTKILPSNPDGIVCTGGYPSVVGGILKTARQLGFPGPIVGTTPAPCEDIARVAGKEWATDWISFSPAVESPQMTPMIKEIRKMCLTKYGQFNQDHLLPWDAIWVIVQGIEKAQSLNTSEVLKAMESMDSFKTSYGPGKLGGLKTYGIKHDIIKPHAITRIVNGEVQHVKWIMPEVP
jgi:branched-chain amino acid transport system substrate-binding protein